MLDEDTKDVDFGCCKIPQALEARTFQRGCDRRAFTKRKLRAGEVILRNAPTAHTLLSAHQQERCARCLSTSRRDDASKTSLLRCGGCKKIWYCSRECQKQDFSFHKFECKQSLLLFSSNLSDTTSSHGSIDNARLLLRNFIVLNVPKNDTTIVTNCRLEADGNVVSCGSKHFENLLPYSQNLPLDSQEKRDIQCAAQALWNQRKAVNSKASSTNLIQSLSQLEDQLETDLRRFRANNFGVTDSMVKVVASAVYPLGALLNHSCAPNCLLRYAFGKKHEPPVMEIVASRDIAKGEELTHSYVELVSPRDSRRASLEEIFGFDCHCEKCKACQDAKFRISLPNNHASLSPIQLSQWILQEYNPSTSNCKGSDNSRVLLVDQETIFQTPTLKTSNNYKTLVDVSNAKQQQAQYCMVTNNLEGELACLNEAVQILEAALVKISDANGKLPLSLDLYKARCTRLGALIVAGGELYSALAMAECEHIVAYLCLALKHVPNHSLLGLQLFTLGDIYDANGEKEKAVKTYTWARNILRISQGDNCDMVLLLNEKIR